MMSKIFVVLGFVLLAASCNGAPRDIPGRIVGGSDVSSEAAPFMAQIWAIQVFFMCGGTVITPKTVLTAAHCLTAMVNPEFYSVIVGTSDLTDFTHRYVAEETILHPNYNHVFHVNDIALVILENSINLELTNVVPITLDPAVVAGGATVTAVGWGVADFPGGTNSRRLQSVQLQTLTNAECQERLIGTSAPQVNEVHMCTFTQQGEGVCNGDSGGPLVRNGYQVGVVSQVRISCAAGFPDVYTRIGPYMSWLQENAQP